jgi:hypothetical protein
MRDAVTTERLPYREGGCYPFRNETIYLVRVNGELRGHVRKFRNTRTDVFPWQAYGPARNGHGGALLGAFYEKDGFKRAVAAVAGQEGGAA